MFGNQNQELLLVPLKDDKTYTFDTIARLFNEQLNISAAGDPVAATKTVKLTSTWNTTPSSPTSKSPKILQKSSRLKATPQILVNPSMSTRLRLTTQKMSFLSVTKSTLRLRQPHVLMNSFHSRIPCQQLVFTITTISSSHFTLERIKATNCPYKESSTDC